MSVECHRQRLTAWWLRHRRWADWAAAALLCAFVVVGAAQPPGVTALGETPRAFDIAAALLCAAAILPIGFRRRRPIAVLATTITAVLVYQFARYPGSGQELGPVVAAYSVGAYCRERRHVRYAAYGLLAPLAGLNIVNVVISNRPLQSIANVLGNTIVFGSALLIGDNVRRRRQRIADLEEQAARDAREREMLARQAIADEQRRIARELHDVVAHSLSVMVVQAGAARRVVASRPEQAGEALHHIESTGREALNEMRRLLGVLRGEESTTLAPQPSLHDVGQLAAADPSLPVSIEITGAPRPLPPAVDLQAYRIVQEALTNVRKHAGLASAEVRIEYRHDGVEVTVTDDGRGASARYEADGPIGRGITGDAFAGRELVGHGLVGMRERVNLVGGTLQVGPRPGGGWLVRAELPTPAGAPVAG